MFSRCIALLMVFSVFSCNNKKTDIEQEKYPVSGLQLLLVHTTSWDSPQGVMQLLERSDTLSQWQLVDSFAVMLGRNGMAWDDNTTLQKQTNEPVKHEGDGCSPAGIFPLGAVFSYHQLDHLQMPFKQVDTNDLCIDDVNSVYYNTMIDADTIKQKDFSTFERMQRNDHQYEYGVWINYNTQPQLAGNGSCIFLHVYKTDSTPTSGCTAMSKENMLKLILWLNADKHPVLMQLPYREHQHQ